MNSIDNVCLLAPNGNLGSGFVPSTLERALEERPDAICWDSGSTDGGPYTLGSGSNYFARPMYERDLRLVVAAARNHGIPLIIGSCAGAGSNPGVDFIADIVRDIVRDVKVPTRLARIYSEQTKDAVRQGLAAGRVIPLYPSEALQPATIERAVRIVAMMGPEPIRAALEQGADIVLAGRSSDSALFASYPLPTGYELGPIWHAGKVLECGAAATVHRIVPDCMMSRVYKDRFTVWTPNPEMLCSAVSVAAHTLYENSDPFRLVEPGGTLRTDDCVYDEDDGGRVTVSGSRFELADRYTVKLEASEPVGYRSLAVGGIADPYILADLDDFLAEVMKHSRAKVADTIGLAESEYSAKIQVYGRDGTVGRVNPDGGKARRSAVGGEVGLLMQAIAPTQEAADVIVSTMRYVALHNPVPHWTGMVTNMANPLSPAVISRGMTYRFSMNQVLELDDPLSIFPTELEELNR